MPRRYLAIPVILLLGLAIYFLRRGGDDGGAAEGDNEKTPTSTSPSPSTSTSTPTTTTKTTTTGTRPPASAEDGTRRYTTETGNEVRDHRDRVVDPVAIPAPLPPEQRTMSTEITAAIYGKLAPIVRMCGIDAPEGGRGENPVVHVTLIVDVAAGQLTTTDATAVATDVPGPTADQVVACVRERASDLTVAANGEPDRTGYVVQYPIRLRK